MYLNDGVPIFETVWQGLGGVVLKEEVWHLGLKYPHHTQLSPSFYALCLLSQDLSSQLLLQGHAYGSTDKLPTMLIKE